MRLRLGSALAWYYLVYITVFPAPHGAGVLFDFCEREDDYYLLESDVGDLFGVFEPFPAFCADVEGEGLEEITWYAIFLSLGSRRDMRLISSTQVGFDLSSEILPVLSHSLSSLMRHLVPRISTSG